MSTKYNLSLVSFINALPFKYGLNSNAELLKQINIVYENPAQCAESIISGKSQIGLLPVAALIEIEDYDIITDYGIAAYKKIDSVLLLSEQPLNKVKNIILDFQSKTSVELIKLLAKSHWRIKVNWINSYQGYENDIKNDTAGLVIGDRALAITNNFNYVIDLAEEWYNYSKLPFVFAVWVAHKNVDKNLIININNSLKKGVNNIDNVLTNEIGSDKLFLANYLKNRVVYCLSDKYIKGLKLFLKEISEK